MEQAWCFAYTVELSWILAQDLLSYLSPLQAHPRSYGIWSGIYIWRTNKSILCVWSVMTPVSHNAFFTLRVWKVSVELHRQCEAWDLNYRLSVFTLKKNKKTLLSLILDSNRETLKDIFEWETGLICISWWHRFSSMSMIASTVFPRDRITAGIL